MFRLAQRAGAQSALALLILSACGGGEAGERRGASPPTATATATVRPTAPTAMPQTPLSVTIESVRSGDAERLFSRFSFSEVGCSSDTWPLPPCSEGEAEGTKTRRFPFVGCEPAFLSEADLRFVLRQVVQSRSPELFAVVETGVPPEPTWFPVGPTAVVFSTLPPEGTARSTGVLLVLNSDGRIVSLRTGCRATPEQMVLSISAGLSPLPGRKLP